MKNENTSFVMKNAPGVSVWVLTKLRPLKIEDDFILFPSSPRPSMFKFTQEDDSVGMKDF